VALKTYDAGGDAHGARPALRSGWRVFRRWLDRERELLSLRNAVGMMSEARRVDAAEYTKMVEMLRGMRADARRLRWLTKDHAHPETRVCVNMVLMNMRTRSYGGACLDIDAAMADDALRVGGFEETLP
jgi:hypothetical protein